MRKVKNLIALSIALTLSACAAVGPDYQPPKVATPDSFVGTVPARFSSEDVERDFWKSFSDQQLDALIEKALAANHDIRIATASLREARALRGEAQLDFAPTVTASADHTEARGSVRQIAPIA